MAHNTSNTPARRDQLAVAEGEARKWRRRVARVAIGWRPGWGLLGVFVTTCIPLGVAVSAEKPRPRPGAAAEEPIVCEIERHLGCIRYDYEQQSLSVFDRERGRDEPNWPWRRKTEIAFQDWRYYKPAPPGSESEHERYGKYAFTNVTEVHLIPGTTGGDELMPKIFRLRHLEKLALIQTDVSDTGLKQLRGHATLRVLRVRTSPFGGEPGVSEAGIDAIQTIPNLEELDLSGNRFGAAEFAKIAGITRLRVLDLDLCGVDDQALEKMAALKSLRQLRAMRSLFSDDECITEAGCAHLRSLTRLEDLGLGWHRLTDGALVHLGKLKTLRRLSIPLSSATASGLAQLEPLSELRELDLSGSYISWDESALRHIGKLRRLRILNLDYGGFASGLEHIAQIPGLVRLNLGGTRVDDSEIAHLGKLSFLEELNLEKCRVTDASVRHLRGLPRLKEIDLGHTCLTDQGLNELAGIESLQLIRVTGTSVTRETVQKLRESHPALIIVATDIAPMGPGQPYGG